MSPTEPHPLSIIGPEKYETAKQDKNFKIAVMSMFKDLKEDMNASLNEVCKKANKEGNEVMKTVPHTEV